MGPTGSRTRQLLPYAIATLLAVVLVVVSVNRSEPSAAAQELLDGEQMKIMAPADPGGGWDSTAREMQASLQELVGRTEVYNVGGAGGTIGLSNFRNLEGQPSQLMVMGLVMVGAIAANESSVTLDEVTPIAELTTESLVIVVPGRLRHPDHRRPGRRARGGRRRGVVGRRLGGRRRADPGRADRPGPRRSTPRTSTTSPTTAAARRSPPCCRAARPPGSAASRSSCRRSSPATCARSRSPAPSRSSRCPTYPRCRSRGSTSSSPTGAASSRRRASPRRSVRR